MKHLDNKKSKYHTSKKNNKKYLQFFKIHFEQGNMCEEISLHGKSIRKYLQQTRFTSETARWGGECELESRS